MSQVSYLRGLRGLGADSRACGIPGAARTVTDEECQTALRGPEQAQAVADVQAEVDAANESAARDSIYMPLAPLPARPGRVSPLSVSWGMPLQTQPVRSGALYVGPRLSPLMIGAGAAFVGVALYLIFKD